MHLFSWALIPRGVKNLPQFRQMNGFAGSVTTSFLVSVISWESDDDDPFDVTLPRVSSLLRPRLPRGSSSSSDLGGTSSGHSLGLGVSECKVFAAAVGVGESVVFLLLVVSSSIARGV